MSILILLLVACNNKNQKQKVVSNDSLIVVNKDITESIEKDYMTIYELRDLMNNCPHDRKNIKKYLNVIDTGWKFAVETKTHMQFMRFYENSKPVKAQCLNYNYEEGDVFDYSFMNRDTIGYNKIVDEITNSYKLIREETDERGGLVKFYRILDGTEHLRTTTTYNMKPKNGLVNNPEHGFFFEMTIWNDPN